LTKEGNGSLRLTKASHPSIKAPELPTSDLRQVGQDEVTTATGRLPATLLAIAIGVVLLGAVVTSAFAQAPVPPAGGILRDVERSLPARRLTSPEGVTIEVPDAPALSSVTDATRVAVRGYAVTGNTVFDAATLQAVIADRIGTLSLADLRRTADELAIYYRARGYLLARAYLPEQEIGEGIVTIAMLEGRYDGITTTGRTRLSGQRAQRLLTHAICAEGDCSGALINREPLERGLLVLNDTPGAQAAARLSPGEYTGSSTLGTQLAEDQLVSGYTQLDNSGSYYSGVARLLGTLWINSPAGIGDQLTLQGMAAGRHGNLDYATVGYGVPLGYRGTRFAIRGSSLRYELGERYDILNAHGTVRSSDVALFHPFARSLGKNLYGSFTYGQRRFHDEAETVGVAARRSVSDRAELALNGDFVGESFGMRATSTVSLLFSSGDLELDATLGAVDSVTTRSAGRYGKWMAGYSRLQPLFSRSSVFVRIAGQLTSDNLDSYEKFALGGPDSVRAYPASDTLVDEAVLYSVEWRRRFGNGARMLEGVLFYDRAHGNFNAAPWDSSANHVRLNGTGIGVNWSVNDRVTLRSTVARRGDRPMTAAPDDDYQYNLVWNMAF
jgi:hemolysin activation/secretion protein